METKAVDHNLAYDSKVQRLKETAKKKSEHVERLRDEGVI